jgi:RNA polymerase sigma-70 factor, ECF subfamily
MGRLSAAPEGPETDEIAHWVEVFEAQVEFVHRMLRHLGAARADVEDLIQEVFLVMWRRRASYDPTRPVRPWIAGIAFRALQEHRRRAGRELPIGLPDLLDEVPGQQDRLEQAQLRALVRAVLARVPEKQRVVLVMHQLDGLTVREISDALAVPLFTVYSQLKRGTRAFAKELRREQAIASLPAALSATSPRALLARGTVAPQARASRQRVRRRVLSLLQAERGVDAHQRATGDSLPQPALRTRTSPSLAALGLGTGALLASLTLVLVPFWPAADPSRAPGPIFREGQRLARSSTARPLALAAVARERRTFSPPEPPAAAAARVADLGRGLMGYWSFDERPGSSRALDRSGAGNHCVLRRLDSAAAWGAGARTGAIALSGKGWLECPATGALVNPNQQLTIAVWVRTGDKQRHYRSVVARQLDWGRQDELMFGFANRDLVFTSHAWKGRVRGPLPPGLGTWFHVAVTRDGDGITILYADGVEVGRGVTRPAVRPLGGNPLILGGAVNGEDPQLAESRFDGGMDELVIYDRALSADEVAELARRAAAGGPVRSATAAWQASSP